MAIAAVGLAISWPLLAVIGIAVRVSSRGPALIRQVRIGRAGVPFTLYKFRTMEAGRSGPGVTAAGDARITAIGRLLRRSKLDELPTFWNVLRGDLAVVGPRPELPEYVDLANPLWRATLHERPGLTHPVTLKLRHEEQLLAASAEAADDYYRQTLLPGKLRGYERYRRRRSWRSDVAVLFATVPAILDPGRTPPPSIEEIVG